MRNHDDFRGMLAPFVLGELSPAERAEVEAHLDSGCAECAVEVRELQEALGELASAAPRMRAPKSVKQRVMTEIRDPRADAGAGSPVSTDSEVAAPPEADPQPSRPKIDEFKTPVWARVALGGMAAACVLLALDGARLRQERSGLGDEIQLLKARVSSLEVERDEAAQWASLIESPTVRFADLAATGADTPTGLAGWALYEEEGGRAAVLLRNAELASAETYQLWVIDEGGPLSLGVVNAQPDADGDLAIQVDEIEPRGAVAAIAVSLEAAGGSPNPNAPTGPVVLVGSLGD